jgi:hypothetical protein
MADEIVLREKARAVVKSGKLPSRRPDRTWSGPGVGNRMNVLVFSIANHPGWRWRILDEDRQTVEDSSASFQTVADARAEGREHQQRRADLDGYRPEAR